MYDGQELQQREHEEEMRARLRRSESIEKAAVSVLWIHRFTIFEKNISQLLALFSMIPLVNTRRQRPSFPSAP